jgi:hypothetical protein
VLKHTLREFEWDKMNRHIQGHGVVAHKLDYSDQAAIGRPSKWGLWASVCGALAVGVPAFIYFILYGGHPHFALDLAVAIICVSGPLSFVSIILVIVAQFSAAKSVPTLIIAWLLVAAQIAMWILVAIDAIHPTGYRVPGGI